MIQNARVTPGSRETPEPGRRRLAARDGSAPTALLPHLRRISYQELRGGGTPTSTTVPRTRYQRASRIR